MAMLTRLDPPTASRVFVAPSRLTELHEADCLLWLPEQPDNSFHAVVTDPPYGMLEYAPAQMEKLRKGRGGVWRIPPSIGGHKRAPVPRFTVLADRDISALYEFFKLWGDVLKPKVVPGAHIFIATSPLFSYVVSQALVDAGYEKRAEIVRLTQTLRGGDRPKNAEEEFPDVTVMPRSAWEPWLVFRKHCDGTVARNLRRWKTGGLRRLPSGPFTDVIVSSPTRPDERKLAPHPSLKPQAFLRQLVRCALPLEQGVVLDPFAGSGSTLAACEALGYRGVGVELDPQYVTLAAAAIPRLSQLSPQPPSSSVFVRRSSDRGRRHSRPVSQRLISE
jgi:site-specific DNA-methyltransferase (adenine-specific)